MQVVAPVLREMFMLSAVGAGAAAAINLLVQSVIASVLNHAVSDGGRMLLAVSTAGAMIVCIAAYLPLQRALVADPLRLLKQ